MSPAAGRHDVPRSAQAEHHRVSVGQPGRRPHGPQGPRRAGGVEAALPLRDRGDPVQQPGLPHQGRALRQDATRPLHDVRAGREGHERDQLHAVLPGLLHQGHPGAAAAAARGLPREGLGARLPGAGALRPHGLQRRDEEGQEHHGRGPEADEGLAAGAPQRHHEHHGRDGEALQPPGAWPHTAVELRQAHAGLEVLAGQEPRGGRGADPGGPGDQLRPEAVHHRGGQLPEVDAERPDLPNEAGQLALHLPRLRRARAGHLAAVAPGHSPGRLHDEDGGPGADHLLGPAPGDREPAGAEADPKDADGLAADAAEGLEESLPALQAGDVHEAPVRHAGGEE
mmetsp:Transcript_70163/g.227099  ORF Transcript_70163/g.227099 Transcript_70163/m.227099 type:complete len:340 (+) Transcript_70163:630-1649(+)